MNCNVHPALSSPVLTKDGFISRSKKTSKLLTSVTKTKLTKRETTSSADNSFMVCPYLRNIFGVSKRNSDHGTD